MNNQSCGTRGKAISEAFVRMFWLSVQRFVKIFCYYTFDSENCEPLRKYWCSFHQTCITHELPLYTTTSCAHPLYSFGRMEWLHGMMTYCTLLTHMVNYSLNEGVSLQVSGSTTAHVKKLYKAFCVSRGSCVIRSKGWVWRLRVWKWKKSGGVEKWACHTSAAASCITQMNLWLNWQRLSCIMGNVSASFWKRRRMHGGKKRRYVWFCCIAFGLLKKNKTVHRQSNSVGEQCPYLFMVKWSVWLNWKGKTSHWRGINMSQLSLSMHPSLNPNLPTCSPESDLELLPGDFLF